MKVRLLKWGIIAAVSAVVASFFLMPAKYVSADEKEIKLDQPVFAYYPNDGVCWFKYVATEERMVQITSDVSQPSYVWLYKDNTDDSSLVTKNYSKLNDYDFSLTWWVTPGTYYYKVIRGSFYSGGNVTVTLKDITDNSVVAAINPTNFPDDVFREYVDSNFDVKDDGVLTRDEATTVYSLNVANANNFASSSIYDLKGIEYFTELTSLYCYFNKISSLDLTRNTKLTEVNCRCNELTYLNVSGLKKLFDLDCDDNYNLTNLVLSHNDRLYYLNCSSCNLKALDVSGCAYLTTLTVSYNNDLSSLKIGGCTALESLSCIKTGLTAVDVSGCDKLTELSCSNCSKLQAVKLNRLIDSLYCYNCKLTSLDLTGSPDLKNLSCYGNNIAVLDISKCPSLVIIYDDLYKVSDGEYEKQNWYRLKFDADKTTIKTQTDANDKVVALDADNFPNEVFRTYIAGRYDFDKDGWLSKSEIAVPVYIDIRDKEIDTLKGIEYFTNLRRLWCSNNNLTELDLSKFSELREVNCSYNSRLTKLNVNNCKKLQSLVCYYCKIESLDVTDSVLLNTLECYGNELEYLDVSNNTKLVRLHIGKNNLTTLILGDYPDLTDLGCEENDFTELDISGCPYVIMAYEAGVVDREVDSSIYAVERNGRFVYYFCVDDDVNVTYVIKPPTPTPTVSPTATPSVTDQPSPSDSPAGPTATPAATSAPAKSPDNPTSEPSVSLILNKSILSVVCGKTSTLKATLTGASGKITWKSSDTKVATVDANGKVKAKMAGTATITATAAGKSASCVVTVLYKDVTNAKDFWYAPTNYLTAKGVVKGYDKQTLFKPANKCTRAQMVTFIWRLMGEPAPKAKTCKFKDVKKTDYFYKACIWGNENKIVEGYKDGTFGPQIVCARRHAVTFLWRLAGQPKPKTTKNPFKDVKKSDYFYKATLWASEKKILAGYSDGTFRPNGDCLRRQMVTFLHKYDKYINKKG